MKHSLITLLIIPILLFGCEKPKKQSTLTKQGINNEAINTLSNDSQLNNFIGIWVREDYIKSLEESKSPLLSSDHLDGISALNINNSKNPNELNIDLLLGDIETSNATLKKENNIFYIEYLWNSELVKTKIYFKHDLINFSIDKKIYQFRKIEKSNKDSDDIFNVKYLTNKILFNNQTYTCFIIENGKRKLLDYVRFIDNGELYGFDRYNSYQIQTNFSVDIAPKDCITLVNSDINKKSTYHFKFNKMDIEFYEINIIKDTIHSEDDEDYEDKESLKLKYVLKKQK